MRPYSLDLRQRVAQAVDRREGSLRQLAKRFLVSLSFITRLLALRRQTHSLAPRPHARGPAPLLDRQGLRRCGSYCTTNPMPSWTSWPSRWAARV